jgi:molybdenum cofactor cytidylyltransferase
MFAANNLLPLLPGEGAGEGALPEDKAPSPCPLPKGEDERPRRTGVILAAGRGGRMGGNKQLLPWPTSDGTKPLVAASYDAIRPICDEMVVVVGYNADMVAAALGERRFYRVDSDYAAPMFESIRAGLRAAQRVDPKAMIVLQPGDHPDVAASTLKALTDWSLQRPAQAIIPEFSNCGGHPTLVPPQIAGLLIDSHCPNGLGQFWLDHPELCHRVPINDPSVVRDIDTPADLAP